MTCIFDREIMDATLISAMRISACVHDSEEVQINIMPADACWPRITFFLSRIAAKELGAILTEAVHAIEQRDNHAA